MNTMRTVIAANMNMNTNTNTNHNSKNVNTKLTESEIREATSAIRGQKSLNIRDIQWYMLDKKLYFPAALSNMFCIRTMLYPLTLVRTRLQIQPSNKAIYSGTFDALRSVVKYEGVLALYKGFLVNNLALFPHVLYITSYEKARHEVSKITDNVFAVAFAGGAAASVVAQVFTVPIDVVTQHMMLAGQVTGPVKSATTTAPTTTATAITSGTTTSSKPIVTAAKEFERIQVPDKMRNASTLRIAKYIAKEIYAGERMAGFYRGYFFSTFLVSLNSALWWPFYYLFQSRVREKVPDAVPTLAVQCACGPLSSFAANFITNPLDVMRANMQISKKPRSAHQVLRLLWKQEGYKLFYKGLTARLSYSAFYSFFIILGYETVKKFSMRPEYQELYYSID